MYITTAHIDMCKDTGAARSAYFYTVSAKTDPYPQSEID